MVSYLILCQNQSQAYRIASLASRSGYYARVMRPPAEISGGSCSFAVKVPERQIAEVLELLIRNRIPRGKLYLINPDGSILAAEQ